MCCAINRLNKNFSFSCLEVCFVSSVCQEVEEVFNVGCALDLLKRWNVTSMKGSSKWMLAEMSDGG